MTPSFDLLQTAAHTDEFRTGEVIFNAGDPGEMMYVVQSGQVDILIGGLLVETVGEGGVIGELAMVDQRGRAATAVAHTDSKLVAIDRQQFEEMLENSPQFAQQVMQIMSERLRTADMRVRATAEIKDNLPAGLPVSIL